MIFGVETIFTIKLLYARKLCTFWCFHPNYQYFNQSIWVTLYICWNILRHYYSWKLSFVLIMFQKPEYLRHNWTRVFVVKQKKVVFQFFTQCKELFRAVFASEDSYFSNPILFHDFVILNLLFLNLWITHTIILSPLPNILFFLDKIYVIGVL